MNIAVSPPDHVTADRVFPFDLFDREADDRLKGDLHRGLLYLHEQAPDVFWTPHNGGHWVVTRTDLMGKVLMDSEHFSTRQMELPALEEHFVAIPVNLDPPVHTPYRRILMQYFAPQPIKAMEQKVRARAARLIDAVIEDGECDFVSAVSVPLPVTVFMEMIGWPLERYKEFRGLVDELLSGPTPERYMQVMGTILGEVTAMIEDRKVNPRDDMMSKLLKDQIDGRTLTHEEVVSICYFLFIAGLDTVANAASFTFRTLGQSPELQARLAANPGDIDDFLAESLRTSGVVNTLRLVAKDVELGGARMRENDIVVVMLPMAGFDDRVNADVGKFDMDRTSHANLFFGTGVHLCAGQYLARLELRVMIEEWLKRIPSFSVGPDNNEFRLGAVMALKKLPLTWQAKAS